MKLLVVGLDCAAPELFLGDERLVNVRRLMEAECFGRLESVVPPITVPAWRCLVSSQDPDSLGPPQVALEIRELVGEYMVDVKGFRGGDPEALRDDLFEMSRRQFAEVRHFVQKGGRDYFHVVNIALDRIQHAFWKYMDSAHPDHVPGSPYASVIHDFYLHLDEELGRLFELVDDDTTILVHSDHGAKALQGGFCVNEWLVSEGLLVLDEYPSEITPFAGFAVNWAKTKVWSEGGYYARVYCNVRGREPQGTIEPAELPTFLDALAVRLSQLPDAAAEPLASLVFRPEVVYRQVRNVAPDLIVNVAGLDWRSIGGVGYHGALHRRENDTGPDGCNHAQFGAFALAGPGVPAIGERRGVTLLDMAPTRLEVGDYAIPTTFQGRSIFGGTLTEGDDTGLTSDGEEIIRQRLSGLGYIS